MVSLLTFSVSQLYSSREDGGKVFFGPKRIAHGRSHCVLQACSRKSFQLQKLRSVRRKENPGCCFGSLSDAISIDEDQVTLQHLFRHSSLYCSLFLVRVVLQSC